MVSSAMESYYPVLDGKQEQWLGVCGYDLDLGVLRKVCIVIITQIICCH